METAWHHSLAKYTAALLWALTLTVSFVSLLVLFGDHYRGHAPMGVIVFSLAALFCVLLLIHAIRAYAIGKTLRFACTHAMFDSIITYSAALTLFGFWALLSAWTGDVLANEGERILLYVLPGMFGCLFWFFGRRA